MALPSFGELMQAYGSVPGPGEAIQAGISGYEKGQQLQDIASQRKLREAQAALLTSKTGAVDLYNELTRSGVPPESIAAAGVQPGTMVSPDQAKFLAATFAKGENVKRQQEGATHRAGMRPPPKPALDPKVAQQFRADLAEATALAKTKESTLGAVTRGVGNWFRHTPVKSQHEQGLENLHALGSKAPASGNPPVAVDLHARAVKELQAQGQPLTTANIAHVIQLLQNAGPK